MILNHCALIMLKIGVHSLVMQEEYVLGLVTVSEAFLGGFSTVQYRDLILQIK